VTVLPTPVYLLKGQKILTGKCKIPEHIIAKNLLRLIVKLFKFILVSSSDYQTLTNVCYPNNADTPY